MDEFNGFLSRYFAPRLEQHGYHQNDKLLDRNLVYGFSKCLKVDIHALIMVHRRQHEEVAYGLGFTIYLVRCKARNVADWAQGYYPGFININLPALLYLVYYLDTIISTGGWWNPKTMQELQISFAEALDQLEEYGIPWLENLETRMPGIPSDRLIEFHQGLEKNVTPFLQDIGFEMDDNANIPFVYRRTSGDLSSFIVFRLGGDRTFEKLKFDVLIYRNRGKLLKFELYQSEGGLQEDLGVLMWKKLGIMAAPYQYYTWEYQDQIGLEGQLEDALSKILEHAIPLLES